MLSGKQRTVWLRVANGVEALSGLGAEVWNEPAAARNALRELLSVLTITHVEIDLDPLRRRTASETDWKTLLARGGDWADLLRELVAAIADAVRGRAEWGIGLPNPARVAEGLGDASERGTLKAGIQLASFLQGFREAGPAFLAVDLTGPAVGEKAVAQVIRNAQLYGWKQAAIVETPMSPPPVEVQLVADATVDDVAVHWQRGDLVGGGLGPRFWRGGYAEPPLPPQCLLYGEIPSGSDAAGIVDAGRRLGGLLA
jgi:hypothetical protein